VVGKGYFEYVVSTEIMEICKEVRGVVADSGSRIRKGGRICRLRMEFHAQ
jgi:hypothetical protein